MLKFIECVVIPSNRNSFSTAQKCWSEVSSCQGFISQYGGWDQNHGNAIILSHWQSQAAINKFMAISHDKIAELNKQHLTYDACTVHYFNLVQTMHGDKKVSTKEIGFVRVASCKLKVDGSLAFLRDQINIWTPAMSGCDGMLGGYVAQSITDPLHYIVISLWCDEQSHSLYMTHQFKLAITQLKLEDYIENIEGYLLPTISSWDL